MINATEHGCREHGITSVTRRRPSSLYRSPLRSTLRAVFPCQSVSRKHATLAAKRFNQSRAKPHLHGGLISHHRSSFNCHNHPKHKTIAPLLHCFPGTRTPAARCINEAQNISQGICSTVSRSRHPDTVAVARCVACEVQLLFSHFQRIAGPTAASVKIGVRLKGEHIQLRLVGGAQVGEGLWARLVEGCRGRTSLEGRNVWFGVSGAKRCKKVACRIDR